jgi:cobalt/nickel transport system permease protein
MTLAFSLPRPPSSLLSRLDPRWKLAALLIASAITATLHTLGSVAVALAAALFLAFLGRLPFRWFLQRLSTVGLVVVLFALPLPWLLTEDGDPWSFGSLHFSQRGLQIACLLTVKAAAVMTFFLVIAATAPLEVNLKAARALRIPGLLVHLGLLTYRYVFVLTDELRRLRIALRVRGYRNRVNWHSYRTAGHIAGTLLVRGFERAERVAQAMRCRGFDGQFRTLSAFTTRRVDVIVFLVITGSAAMLGAWDWLLMKL